jgi:TctA family transporter
LTVPYRWLFPCIIVFCAFGNYTVNSSVADVYVCAAIGVLGYVLARLDCPPAPMVLGYVLGPQMEEYMRRALLLSGGDPMVFFRSPLSLLFLVAAVLLLISMSIPSIRRKKSIVYEEEPGAESKA